MGDPPRELILKGYSTYRKAKCNISNEFKDIDNKLLEYDELLGKPVPDILWLVPRELLSTPDLKEKTLLKLTGTEDNPGLLGIGESIALTNNNKQPPELTGEVVFRVNRNSGRHSNDSTPHYTHFDNVNVQINKLSVEGARRLNRGWATTLDAPNEKARQCALLIQGNKKVAGKETKTRKVRPSWMFQSTATIVVKPLGCWPVWSYRLNPSPNNQHKCMHGTLSQQLLPHLTSLQVRSVNSIEVWLKSEDISKRAEAWKVLDKHARGIKIPRTEFLTEEGKKATESQDTIRADQFTAEWMAGVDKIVRRLRPPAAYVEHTEDGGGDIALHPRT